MSQKNVVKSAFFKWAYALSDIIDYGVATLSKSKSYLHEKSKG